MVAKKRIAVIDKDGCINGKGCPFLCASVCPVNRQGKECIVLGEDNKPVISEKLCIGCGICPRRCPTRVISIVNLSVDLGKPMHLFGENQFRLFRLPLPREKAVVGLVGRNGIGKTTALKVLAKELVPNLGELGKSSWDKVIEFYRGREAQAFFKDLQAEKIKVAVKPQNISALPKAVKGKVGDLLKKVDEKNALESVVEGLELKGILEREIGQLSGGELQKTAIAAASLKEANFYFFDEPTTYLDIRERLRVARFIRGLAEKDAVIVVEHDLILLDYLSDFVHLMYGEPAVFGIVSQVKTTREGINTYLEGYSKEENYRFRPYPIEFTAKVAREVKKGKLLSSWSKLEKKFKAFELTVEANSINRNEVVGILGPNAIGKTTFVKMLASALKPDQGNVDLKLKIAYKPQYIEFKSKETVAELLGKQADLSSPEIENSIIKPLDLKPLMEKPASQLSGGEAQRLAIALTLTQPSDLILMDEPSAFLDIEQRLKTAKAIRSLVDVRDVSALIVDHDLVFIDFIADRLMVFSGKPALKGLAQGPFDMETGMNALLKNLGVTLRRDKASKRPRINKPGSVKDQEQKASGKYYYE